MSEEQRDDLEQKVEQASGGEPAADVSPDDADIPEPTPTTGDTSSEEAPEGVNEEAAEADSDRIRSMQQEGKGIRGRATDGREDLGDEDVARDAAEDR